MRNLGRRNLQSWVLLRVSLVSGTQYHENSANTLGCTVPTAGAAMPSSTAVLAASLASVNAVPDLPPRLVPHLSHPWTFLGAMDHLPRQLAP
jgi:hypothetical protein